MDDQPWTWPLEERLRRVPAPGLPAEAVAALAGRGLSYLGSYTAWEGHASGAGTRLHVLFGRWTPRSAPHAREKTDTGVEALLNTRAPGEIQP